MGLNPAARRADALTARTRHGTEGEKRTAALLAPLEAAGWHIWHDRALPRSRANLDHVLAFPDGKQLVVVDSKKWDYRLETKLVRGRVHCGKQDRHEEVEKVVGYAERVAKAVGLPVDRVDPLLVIHGSRIPAGSLTVRMPDGRAVHVLPAGWLMSTLTAAARKSPPDPEAAAALAARVDRILPRYVE
ncbi:nuclease-related domain-containing protein [Leifsonia sp. NPDC058292]|uniref:nuclease-related domain-containing protein n=1 Tax=Leifsonia sp. NPDC058292 TaxID=3346428 RepID=UPI0036DB115E